MDRVVPRLRATQLAAISTVAVLAVVAGVGAGLAARGSADLEPPDPTWCPQSSPEHPAARSRCPAPVAAGTAPTRAAPPPDAPLRVLAEPLQLRVGSAVSMEGLADEAYREVLGREFNSVTAETAMKWSALEPAPGRYDRGAADRLVEFARQHDQQVYGHALLWHRQVPDWVRDGSYSDAELRELLRGHVQETARHFRGTVWAWDVVNEVLAEDGTLRDSLWLRRLGPEYVADVFRWAHEADPDAALFINDFGIEGINAKSDALYRLVDRLQGQGVPIHGVGFQVHWTLEPLPASFAENLRRFAALGLQVAITEMDVRMPYPVTPQRLTQQASIYSSALATCVELPRCVSFTVWGFSDAHSWVPHVYPDRGAAALFDARLRPKPAYRAVTDVLRGA